MDHPRCHSLHTPLPLCTCPLSDYLTCLTCVLLAASCRLCFVLLCSLSLAPLWLPGGVLLNRQKNRVMDHHQKEPEFPSHQVVLITLFYIYFWCHSLLRHCKISSESSPGQNDKDINFSSRVNVFFHGWERERERVEKAQHPPGSHCLFPEEFQRHILEDEAATYGTHSTFLH